MRLCWAALALLAVTACREPAPVAPTDASAPGNARAACLASGGAWAPSASPGSFTCLRRTRDANRPCDAATDCEGLCLARSRTCAPVTPLFGCHEVLGIRGARATLCVD